jgi:hypothetical protein
MTSQYGVKTYFFIRKFNEIYMYEVISIKIIVYSRAPPKNKFILSLVEYT